MHVLSKLLFSFLISFSVCVCIVPNTKADPITITLASPTQSGLPGTTLVFSGTLTNVGPPIALIRGSQLSVPPPLLFSGFFLPNLDLQPGANTGVIPLFGVSIDPTFHRDQPTMVDGFFSVNAASPFPFASTTYHVIVQPAPTPEPTTVLLFGVGLVGAYVIARGRCIM